MSFTYPSTGNRTQQREVLSGTTINYSYDQANRLTNYNNGVATYRYNGDGLRMAKTRSGQAEEQFTWDTVGGLPLLLQDGQASYIYGPGGMVLEQVSNSGTVHYYHQDQLGSIRALTDSRGRVTATYNYDAYGNRTSSTGTAYNPFGYAGEYTDSESGLQYLRARYYDPQTQQFLTVDPMLASTEQAYAYAAGSPTNFTDPSGLVKGCPWCPDIDAEQIEDDLCNMFGFFCDDTDRAKGAQDFGWDRIAGGAQVCGNAIGQMVTDNSAAINQWGYQSAYGGGYGMGRTSGQRSWGQVRRVDQWTAKLSGMLQKASQGTGNFGVGSATRSQADELGRAWVGQGARLASSGKIWISADGLRQYRPPSYKPKHGIWQANLERRAQPSGPWNGGNAHIDIVGR